MSRRGSKAGLADHFGPLELAILDALWGAGELDVAECAKRIPGDQAYTTVKTVMERLVQKGFLARRKEARAYLYWATDTRAQVEARIAAEQTQRLLEGFGDLAVTNFVESVRGDAARLEHLRGLLAEVADQADAKDDRGKRR